MKTKPLDCEEIYELFPDRLNPKLRRCCIDCHEDMEDGRYGFKSYEGKLRNGWSYKTCCSLRKEIIRKKL